MAPDLCLREGGGAENEILGIPDFMILDGDDYIIREAKMASRIDEESHTRFCFRFNSMAGSSRGAAQRAQRPCKFSAA